MNEIDEIKRRYKKREKNKSAFSTKGNLSFEINKNREREKRYEEIIKKWFSGTTSDVKFLEIGAGDGKNVNIFKSFGIKSENIWTNELIPDRIETIKKRHNDIHVLEGNALEINNIGPFDIILQSLVFTSILDQKFKNNLAQKMYELIKSNGIIIWYDFVYNNPRNPDVKGVSRKKIKVLFPGANISFCKVTLVPLLGRRLGRFYNFINYLFPCLRTHVIAVIKKQE